MSQKTKQVSQLYLEYENKIIYDDGEVEYQKLDM